MYTLTTACWWWQVLKPVTKLSDATFPSNESLIEMFRYRSDTSVVNRTSLVAELSLYPDDPDMLSRLGFPVNAFHQRENLSQFVFVSAADTAYFYVDMDAIALIQAFFPNHSIYFYDLSNGMLDYKADKV